jgi:phosphate transport system ATP-binding protein
MTAVQPIVAPPPAIAIRDLHAGRAQRVLVDGVDLDLPAGRISAIIGPAGCGKSTILRCINRLHETTPAAWVRGAVAVDGADVYAPGVDAIGLRRRVGLVLPRPTLLPSRTVRENVLLGPRLTGRVSEPGDVEAALRAVGLWASLRDQLDRPLGDVQPGPAQRLCLARALAMRPEVLLLDEPCLLLDPVATARIEDALAGLAEHYTVVLATRDAQQAARVADRTAFVLAGRVIECDESERLFTDPQDDRTEDYITGRFA